MSKEQELKALSEEIFERREKLIADYKKTHTLPSRGQITTPELMALNREEKRRYFEILEKYKGNA